jgi:hypothetical protein
MIQGKQNALETGFGKLQSRVKKNKAEESLIVAGICDGPDTISNVKKEDKIVVRGLTSEMVVVVEGWWWY